MKRQILILCFLACFQAVKSQNIVYAVSYDSAGVIVCKKAHKIETVEKILHEKFDKFKTDGVFFDLYIEKKLLTKNGKLKRLKK